MRRNSNRPSIAILIAALALAACQSTPAAPPTQTPVNPTDTFATPGAPTPFLPTMTPAPSPTVRPTATAVPPTAVPATVALPTLAPTKGATPTPTPVIINGQPKMWWVDQMVKQADGSYIPPRVVTETIVATFNDLYSGLRAENEQLAPVAARRIVSDRVVMANRFLTGTLLVGTLSTQSEQVQVAYTGETTIIDVRGFGPDGLSGYYTIHVKGTKANVYNRNDWSMVTSGLQILDFYEIWKIVFDVSAGRWKIQERVAGGTL